MRCHFCKRDLKDDDVCESLFAMLADDVISACNDCGELIAKIMKTAMIDAMSNDGA